MADTPIKWKTGVADEVWKVMICARDAARAREMLQGVAYIVGGASNRTDQEAADLLSRLSGAQIVQALLDYQEGSAKAVARALAARETKET